MFQPQQANKMNRCLALFFLLCLPPVGALARDCQSLNNRAGEYDCDLLVAGKNREYTLFVPRNFNANAANAILVDMHGYNGTRFNHPPFTGWQTKAQEEGFIYVSPQGIDNSWNADICCGGNQEDDVAFLKAIIEQVKASFNIDGQKVFATGHSNGGGMSQKLACDAADVFKGIASVAFPITQSPQQCNPAFPPRVIHFHGLSDTVIRYDGGSSGTRSAPESLVTWKAILNCQSGPEVTYSKNSAICETYSNCDGGKSTTLCTIRGNHFLYDNRDRLNIPDVAWDYLINGAADDDDDGTPIPIVLTAEAGSFWFWSWVDLSWKNASGNSVAVVKDDSVISTTPNDGSYRDFSGGSRQYRVCEIDTNGQVLPERCSSLVEL